MINVFHIMFYEVFNIIFSVFLKIIFNIILIIRHIAMMALTQTTHINSLKSVNIMDFCMMEQLIGQLE